MALILYHIIKPDKKELVAGLCKRLGLAACEIKGSDAGQTVGMLAGTPARIPGSGRAASKKPVPVLWYMPELIVFAGLTDVRLDEFLGEYRKAGIEPVALKAVMTQHNVNWSIYELCMELMRERSEIETGLKKKS